MQRAWLTIVAMLLPCAALMATNAAQSKTQVVLLGTGTPNADPERAGPAVAVVVNDTPYLIDCGPGVVRRAAAAARKGVKGLSVEKLRRAFITHLHSDHTVGYPDLIFTPAVLERNAPLEVYGPPGLRAMTQHILAAYKEDIAIRLHGLEPSKPAGYVVNAHEIKPGPIYRDDNVAVKAFALPHGSWKYAFGYRFETADRVVVISGDTARTRPDSTPHSGQAASVSMVSITTRTHPGPTSVTSRTPYPSRPNSSEVVSFMLVASQLGLSKTFSMSRPRALTTSRHPTQNRRAVPRARTGRGGAGPGARGGGDADHCEEGRLTWQSMTRPISNAG